MKQIEVVKEENEIGQFIMFEFDFFFFTECGEMRLNELHMTVFEGKLRLNDSFMGNLISKFYLFIFIFNKLMHPRCYLCLDNAVIECDQF